MRGKLGDKARLNHIVDAISEVENYLLHADFEIFINHSRIYRLVYGKKRPSKCCDCKSL